MKLIIEGKVNKSLDKIKEIQNKIQTIEKSRDYSEEYKEKTIKKLEIEIREINNKLAEEVKGVFDARIDTLKAQRIIKGVDDKGLNSILAMLQISKNNLNADELQQIYDDNKDHTIITRAIKGIAEERQINLNIKPNNIEELTGLRDNIYSQILTDGADSLGFALKVNYLPE